MTNVDVEAIDARDPRRPRSSRSHPTARMRAFASGLRNPLGLDGAPGRHRTVVNEWTAWATTWRPITSPASATGVLRVALRLPGPACGPLAGNRPDLRSAAWRPTAIGAHTASLARVLSGQRLSGALSGGAFIGQRGSEPPALAGYRVLLCLQRRPPVRPGGSVPRRLHRRQPLAKCSAGRSAYGLRTAPGGGGRSGNRIWRVAARGGTGVGAGGLTRLRCGGGARHRARPAGGVR
jgi:hypothetical protein